QGEDAALARGVGDLGSGGPDQGRGRGGVDDRPRALTQHDREHGTAAEVDAGQVDLLHAPPGVQLRLEDGPVLRRADPRVVHGDVDAAVMLEGERVHPQVVVGVGDVGPHVQAADGVGDVLAPDEVHDDDLRTFGGEPAAHGRADPAAATGDDRDPAVEAVHSGVT